MEIKLFTIPIIGGEKLEATLNAFLRSQKILQIDHQLTTTSLGTYWCFCIKFIESSVPPILSTQKDKPDYKEVLDDASFKRFTQFREIRKSVALEEAIPAYAVFTNAELAEIAKIGPEITLSDLEKIPGIGKKKVEKYGHHFVSENEKSH